MKFENDFKKAISELPDKEKDKLLYRLLKKDRILAAKLEFELLGNESQEERRQQVEATIRATLSQLNSRFRIELLQKELRKLTTAVTEHMKITSDKEGEVSLNLLLLIETLQLFGGRLENHWWNKAEKLNVYLISKVFKSLILLRTLHEDYHADYTNDLQVLGRLIEENSSLLRSAKRNQLQMEWLTEGDVPKNMKEIHAQVRKQGLLKL